MSWYSGIYTKVRNVRDKRPVFGYILHILLNLLLSFQIILFAYCVYVYVFVLCGKMLTSNIQASIYLFVFGSLTLMMVWSLVQTIFTSVSRVPAIYYVDEATDKKLKEVTPFANDRYVPDKSSATQIEDQIKILVQVVEQKHLLMVETDHYGRVRYCYQCSLLKPDRSHHCSSCGFCVVKYDHHCPWINKCVSHSNYKFFLLYLFYGCALVIWTLATSLEGLIRYFVHQNWAEEAGYFVQLLISMIMCAGFGYYPLGELLIYHYGLIALNETTCEQAKPPIIRGDYMADYNFGRAFNFRAVFGWGLWLFPVNTTTIDGLHFPVHYTDNALPAEKICVRPMGSSLTD
ncbi:unnamed protein product [Bursaphelenchus okinawaensis]|uniref:Palmitoyltransferase n=1 Tax=Bursaphelenchus okinawaensis TaxID=465554 RepID=A0A811LDI3_9BILA|nr:unnamed protein product [Bursaphelenchus okinawaensis]CAG9121136.1 unnamed protein product [Bursaphelenchus okinawaensis]